MARKGLLRHSARRIAPVPDLREISLAYRRCKETVGGAAMSNNKNENGLTSREGQPVKSLTKYIIEYITTPTNFSKFNDFNLRGEVGL
jgi:hypothetical protein